MDTIQEKHNVLLDNAETSNGISFNDLLDELIRSPKPSYVVGAGIRDFREAMNALEMFTYWDAAYDNEKFTERFRYHMDCGVYGSTASMYAYIDYVLEETDCTLLLFVPSQCRTSELCASPTRDEMVRAVSRMDEFPGRIVFVSGFYDWVGA